MIDINYDNYLNNYLWNKIGIKSKTLYKISNNKYCEEYKYLIQRYTDSRSIKESVYRIKYNIEEIPKCPICGNLNNFISGKKGYTKHCCYKCTQLDKNVREKNEKTCLLKYGVKNGAQSKQAKDNYIKHIREKYNDPNITNVFQVKEVIEKIKKSTFKHYGVTNYGATKEHILRTHTKEINEKRENTKLKNNTLNSSKPELESYKLLKEKYNDTIHHYKDKKRYPFNCDFYIPSLDLFIECQYGQFHNHKPYLNSKENINELNILKEKSIQRKKETGKNKSRYDSVIETWTIRDPKKRKIAKENNLNYIEFWNINELKEWLKNTI